MCNLSYAISRSGFLKIISVIIGILSLYGGIRGYIDSGHNQDCEDAGYFDDADIWTRYNGTKSAHDFQVHCDLLWMERFFLGGVSLIMLISVILLLTFVFSRTVAESTISNIIDFGFHFAGSIVLMVCGIFLGFSAIEINDNICNQLRSSDSECQLFYEKIGGAGLAVFNGIVFVTIVLSVNKIRTFQKVEQV